MKWGNETPAVSLSLYGIFNFLLCQTMYVPNKLLGNSRILLSQHDPLEKNSWSLKWHGSTCNNKKKVVCTSLEHTSSNRLVDKPTVAHTAHQSSQLKATVYRVMEHKGMTTNSLILYLEMFLQWLLLIACSVTAKAKFWSSSNCFSVNIVSRSQWGAAAPQQKERLKGSAQRVIIHHTAFPSCKSLTECKDQLFSIQRMHMKERDFDDIGYKWVVLFF